MIAGRLNLTVDGGATFARDITVYDANGDLFDLTGYRSIMQVRSRWLPSGVLYATWGTTAPYSGITIASPATGVISVGPIDRTDQLDDIPVDSFCVYDLFIYVPSGVEYRIVEGTFRVRPYSTQVP